MVERLKLGIEVAQKAVKKSQPDTDNLTHDWEVIISGAAGNISSYVEKVQFNLHESFTNPIRLVSQADEAGAYVCRAAGYAGFLMPINIYFRDGNKTQLVHDLTLSFDKRETYKTQTHDISVNVKPGKWKDLAIQCGAKVNADNGRKSPPLLTSGSRDSRREHSEKSRKKVNREGEKEKPKKEKKKKDREKDRDGKSSRKDKVRSEKKNKEIDQLFDPELTEPKEKKHKTEKKKEMQEKWSFYFCV